MTAKSATVQLSPPGKT